MSSDPLHEAMIIAGAGNLYDPDTMAQVKAEFDSADNPLVQLRVLLEDTDGSQGYPPEWAGHKYARGLIELAGNREKCIEITWDGYDFDPREVWQIPAIQRFCLGLLGWSDPSIPGTPPVLPHQAGMVFRALTDDESPIGGGMGSKLRIYAAADQALPPPLLSWHYNAGVWATHYHTAQIHIVALMAGVDNALDFAWSFQRAYPDLHGRT